MIVCEGDVIAFPGKGIIFQILSRAICALYYLFKRNQMNRVYSWGRRYWHLGIAWRKVYTGWLVLEALSDGVQLKFHPIKEIARCRTIPLNKKIDTDIKKQFFNHHIGQPYDADVYLGTVFYFFYWILFKKMFRIVDSEQMCWELARSWLRANGKPIAPNNKFTIIVDFFA